MAAILMAWELGTGMGHLDKMRTIGSELVRRGHRVVAAVRELNRAGDLFDGTGVDVIPAPFKPGRTPDGFSPPQCYAHILHNTCFADLPVLKSLLTSWR